MKRSIIIFVITISGFIASAQTNQPAKKSLILKGTHEFGLNLFSLKDVNSFFNYLQFNYLPGFYYKYHKGKNAFRFSFDYYQSNLNESRIYRTFHYPFFDILREQHIKIGYQRSFGEKYLRPFVYADVYVVFHKKKISARQIWSGTAQLLLESLPVAA